MYIVLYNDIVFSIIHFKALNTDVMSMLCSYTEHLYLSTVLEFIGEYTGILLGC